MSKITPCLWFGDEAREAATFYASNFPDSAVFDSVRHPDTGDEVTVPFRCAGRNFVGLNGGPEFRFTPAVSFYVDRLTSQEVDVLFHRLVMDGEVLMPPGDYGFSPRFAWLNDRYGLSWQLSASLPGDRGPRISPCFMFVGEQHGKAEAAMQHYAWVFDDSTVEEIDRYAEGEAEPEGTLRRGWFTLAGGHFLAMDSGLQHDFAFNEAVSLMVRCDDQEELDTFWMRLSQGGEKGQCGWLKDRYGVYWQVVPEILMDRLQDRDKERASRVWEAMLGMKKIEIDGLDRAYEGPG